jgi:hypothetical protein
MSYGIEQYGIDPYGSLEASLLGGFNLVRARPVSTNVVRVTFSQEPQNISAQLPGDVLNPREWKLVRLDTGVGFTILSISATPAKLEWDVRVLEALASSNISHRISALTLLDTFGDPIAQDSADFFGILDASLSTPDRQVANQRYAIRDLNNPQASLASGSTGGVYAVGKNGDYQLHDGTDFVRKLILRRLMTTKGAFRFLPDFGVGLRVKEPLPTGDLISLQNQISDQVKQEPEVEKVRVSVSQDQNKLTVVVLAVLKLTGQQISIPLSTPFGVTL